MSSALQLLLDLANVHFDHLVAARIAHLLDLVEQPCCTVILMLQVVVDNAKEIGVRSSFLTETTKWGEKRRKAWKPGSWEAHRYRSWKVKRSKLKVMKIEAQPELV